MLGGAGVHSAGCIPALHRGADWLGDMQLIQSLIWKLKSLTLPTVLELCKGPCRKLAELS